KIANDTAVAVNQGGKRKGAVCAYLETWHIDIEEFLDLRKNTGDERRRTHDMNTANWVPDLFMRRVEADGQWTLFSPDEVPNEQIQREEIIEKVVEEIGKIAKPEKIQFVPGLPKTRSGKIMRRILRKVAEGELNNLGDTTTLLDPEVVDEIIKGRIA